MQCRSFRRLLGTLLVATPILAGAATGDFDPDIATRAYLDTLQGAARNRSNAYFEGGYWLILWGAIVAIVGEWIILRSGLSARFRALGERVSKWRGLVPAVYAAPYLIASTLIVLPWSIYTGFLRERKYDLMNLSFARWLGEQATALLIAIIVFTIFFPLLFAVIRRTRHWWLWATGVATAFLTLIIVIAPVFIAPLFNEYTPMADGLLRDKILAMAQAHDVPADNVYVFDQSKQHDRISANVSGLFGTMRISLNDNLLSRSAPEEIASVMGHELGHYVLNHALVGVAILTLVLALGLFLVARLTPRILARYGEQWGVRGVDDPAVLPVFSIILGVYFLAATPVINTMVRTFENQADAFGLDTARQPDGFASIAMKLSEYRKIEPGVIEEMLFFDHPSGRTRVRMAMDWKAKNVANPSIVRPPPMASD